MRTLSLMLACILFAAAANGQTSAISPSSNAQNSDKQPAETADLNEANRLSAKVVELYTSGKYDEAIPVAKRVIDLREKVLGVNNATTASAYINLAEVYLAKRSYDEAAASYDRVLSIYDKVFGADSLNSAPIVESLALINYLKGNFSKSESLYQKSLSIKEQNLGSENKEVAKSALALAEFYRSRREYKKAEPLFLRAIVINDKTLPKTDPEFGHVLQRYDCFVYESKGVEAAQKDLKEFYDARRDKSQRPTAGEVLNGRALSLPGPPYPDEALRIRASGVVLVQVKIDVDGKVIDAHSVCGPAVFARVAIAAALRARFTPTKLSGMPVEVNGIIIYNFVAR